MIKLKKQLMTLLLTFFIITSSACNQTTETYLVTLKKPIDIASISRDDKSALLILDNLSNQLFLNDLNDNCYLDFSETTPLTNGLVLAKYPYKLSVSNDNSKAVILSSDKTITIVNLDPYFNFYQKDCKKTTLPEIEFKKQLEKLPNEVRIKKSEGFNYEILTINNTSIDFYSYDGKELNLIYHKDYNNEILSTFTNEDGYFISLKGENSIFKIASDGTEEIIDLTDISVEYTDINKFIVTKKYIYVYNNYENRLFVWDIEASKYIEIKSSFNPLSKNDIATSKSLKLDYNLNSMSIYKQEYNLKADEFLNGLGYLNLHQLLEGDYLLITDNGGFFYFLTIDTNNDLITNYPEETYASIDEYKDAINKRFLEFQIPLQTDYKPEVLTVTQSQYCTQFNRHEANQCFYTVNTEENISNNESFVIIKDEVKNRDYDLSNDSFKFTFEAGLNDFINNDGVFTSSDTMNSVSTDFSKLTLEASSLQLEIISELPENKIDDVKCERYKTVTEEQKASETNRKYYRLVPILNISNHELSLDVTNDPNLSYCYDEAIAFQVRLKNLFLVSTIENGEIGTSSYCTTNEEINSLCNGENKENCPENCEDAPFYENDLFKIKIFSDKGEMDIGSYISFSLAVTSTYSRYRHSMISPLKSAIFKNSDDNQSKNGIAIIDSYNNNILTIDTNDFNTVTRIIQ